MPPQQRSVKVSPYRGPVAGMEWIEPVSVKRVNHRKVIKDCGIDSGVEPYQTVEDKFAVKFLKWIAESNGVAGWM